MGDELGWNNPLIRSPLILTSNGTSKWNSLIFICSFWCLRMIGPLKFELRIWKYDQFCGHFATLNHWIITRFFFQAQVGHLQMQKMVNKVNLWGMLSIFILVVLARLHVTWKIYVQYTWSLSWEVIENGDIFFARVSYLKTILWWNNRPRKEYTQRPGPEILCLPPPKKVRDCALVDEVQSGAWVGASSVVVVFVFLFLAWHYRTAFKEVCQKIKDLPSKGMSDWHLDHPQEATVWYKSRSCGAISVQFRFGATPISPGQGKRNVWFAELPGDGYHEVEDESQYPKNESTVKQSSRWWFPIFFILTPTWGNDPIWLIFFRWVETTN